MARGVERNNQANYNYPTGIGYVVLPERIDRGDYIQMCYRRERISILLDNGGDFVRDCYIDKSVLQNIEFPATTNELGSCIAFINERFNNKPIIVAVLSKEDETQFLEENTFEKIVGVGRNNISIVGRGADGRLSIDVEADTDNGGVFVLNVRNLNRNAQLQINCYGDSTIYNEGNTTIRSTATISAQTIKNENNIQTITSNLSLNADTGLNYSDMWENQVSADNEGNINVIGQNVRFNNGESPLVKGDEIQTQLNKSKDRIDTIISALRNSLTGTSDGGLLYKQNITAALIQISDEDVENFESINSENVFTN